MSSEEAETGPRASRTYRTPPPAKSPKRTSSGPTLPQGRPQGAVFWAGATSGPNHAKPSSSTAWGCWKPLSSLLKEISQ